MSFADGTKAQNKSTAVCGGAGLIGMTHDARIEQGRGFEGIFVKKIGSDQATLCLVQYGMRVQRFFHLSGARLENLQQIPVATIKVFENLGQLSRCGAGVKPEDSIDDMVGSGLIGGI